MGAKAQLRLTFRPLTPDRWPDYETLFGKRGAYDGCWCMWRRVTRAQFEKQKGLGNKRAMKRVVTQGAEPGVLAYKDGVPIGWCAIAPREAYPGLNRSRTLRRVDDEPAWSITCFYVDAEFHGRGVMAALLEAATEFAVERGARHVEGYPIGSEERPPSSLEAYRGTISAFREAGFVEVVRRSARLPIMRFSVEGR